MPPSACLIDPPPADDLLAPLSALFSPLFYISPIPDAGDGRILALSPPLDEASALRLKEIAAALSSGEAARHGERLRGLVAELLDGGADEPESGREVIRTLRRSGEKPDGDPLLRERLTLLLAAQARREQAELERDLARIERRRCAVFADLREDDAETQDAAPAQASAAASLDRRAYLRAWLRLLEHTPLPCPNPWFITFDAALADALLARYRQGGGEPVALAPISLSADGAGALPQGLAALQNATTEAEAREAARALANAAPSPAPGQPELDLHILPGAALPDLLPALFAEETTRNRQSAETPCLLGVVQTP